MSSTPGSGPQITDSQEKLLFEQMRQLGTQHEFMVNSMSGTSQAESELPRIQRLFYVAIWSGHGVEESISECDQKWRSYAEKNNARVEAAPKTMRGPYEGASNIHYRWVNPDRFTDSAQHLRAMVEKILTTSQEDVKA